MAAISVTINKTAGDIVSKPIPTGDHRADARVDNGFIITINTNSSIMPTSSSATVKITLSTSDSVSTELLNYTYTPTWVISGGVYKSNCTISSSSDYTTLENSSINYDSTFTVTVEVSATVNTVTTGYASTAQYSGVIKRDTNSTVTFKSFSANNPIIIGNTVKYTYDYSCGQNFAGVAKPITVALGFRGSDGDYWFKASNSYSSGSGSNKTVSWNLASSSDTPVTRGSTAEFRLYCKLYPGDSWHRVDGSYYSRTINSLPVVGEISKTQFDNLNIGSPFTATVGITDVNTEQTLTGTYRYRHNNGNWSSVVGPVNVSNGVIDISTDNVGSDWSTIQVSVTANDGLESSSAKEFEAQIDDGYINIYLNNDWVQCPLYYYKNNCWNRDYLGLFAFSNGWSPSQKTPVV